MQDIKGFEKCTTKCKWIGVFWSIKVPGKCNYTLQVQMQSWLLGMIGAWVQYLKRWIWWSEIRWRLLGWGDISRSEWLSEVAQISLKPTLFSEHHLDILPFRDQALGWGGVLGNYIQRYYKHVKFICNIQHPGSWYTANLPSGGSNSQANFT